MPDPLFVRIKNAWNVFRGQKEDAIFNQPYSLGPGYSIRPDRTRMYLGTERSLLSSIFTKIGVDVASNQIRHVRLDNNENFVGIIKSGLNECLSLEANIDQTGVAFIQDVAMSLCDEGTVAIVPVDTTFNPTNGGSFDILSMRTGKIVEWFPAHVRVSVYNDRTGNKEEILLPKTSLAIIENPLYAVMNEPNSTLKRLIQKMNLLDAIDIQSGSGKLDLIIQLPYVIKTEARKQQAENRRKDIEEQLQGSKYGIAYTDGTEHITQLNRPAENNLMSQIEFLTKRLYGQLGLTEAVFNGTADEKEMLNYYNRTIYPILGSICDGMTRRFLTKTGRTQGQAVSFLRDPFKFVPAVDFANIADTFTRNEIMTSNEIRSKIGMPPSSDPSADELRNKNISGGKAETMIPETVETNQNGSTTTNGQE